MFQRSDLTFWDNFYRNFLASCSHCSSTAFGSDDYIWAGLVITDSSYYLFQVGFVELWCIWGLLPCLELTFFCQSLTIQKELLVFAGYICETNTGPKLCKWMKGKNLNVEDAVKATNAVIICLKDQEKCLKVLFQWTF